MCDKAVIFKKNMYCDTNKYPDQADRKQNLEVSAWVYDLLISDRLVAMPTAHRRKAVVSLTINYLLQSKTIKLDTHYRKVKLNSYLTSYTPNRT